MEAIARSYIKSVEEGNSEACIAFVKNTIMGTEVRPRGFKAFIQSFFGNANHLWMWDTLSMQKELKDAGFSSIRKCEFDDSEDEMFKLVENKDRFAGSIAFECRK